MIYSSFCFTIEVINEINERKFKVTKPCLWILHNMPRSGGTLVSKCFAAMDSHVLLSEIHPGAQHVESFNVLSQAQKWHNILPQLNWRDTAFVEAVTRIEQSVREQGKQLILRDWSHADYLGPPVTNQPNHKPALLNVLSADFDIKSIQLVRHPLDTWLSLRKLNLIIKHKIDASQFLAAYRQYLVQTQSMYCLRYEDFLEAPCQQLSAACDSVGLTFDQGYQDRWFDFEKVTGDTSNNTSLRKSPEISPRPRRDCGDVDISWFHDQADYRYIIDSTYS